VVVELRDRVVEVELLDHLAHVRAEALDVAPEVRGQVLVVVEELLEVEGRGVVEGVAGGLPEEGVGVLQPVLVLPVGLQHLLLRRGQDLVDPPQHRERQDHVLVRAPLEAVADEVGDAPEEGDDLGVGHGVRSRRMRRSQDPNSERD